MSSARNTVENLIIACSGLTALLFIVGIFLVAVFIWYTQTRADKMRHHKGMLTIASIFIGLLLTIGFTLSLIISVTFFCNPSSYEDDTVISVANENKIEEQQENIQNPLRVELRRVHSDNDELVAKGVENIPGWSPYIREYIDYIGQIKTEKLFLENQPQIITKDIKSVAVDYSRTGHVSVVLSPNGADRMWAVTKSMQKGHDRLAIIVDDKVISAPVVQDNLSKSFTISGLGKPDEAEDFVKRFYQFQEKNDHKKE